VKAKRIVTILEVIAFILLFAGYALGFYFYTKYREEVEYFKKQNELTEQKFGDLQSSMDKFKLSLRDLDSQFKKYGEDLLSVEEMVNSAGVERKDILLKVEEMKKNIQSIEEKYESALKEVKEKIENVKNTISSSKEDITKSIDLGEISVSREDK
jgi:chromosome segregation ATPase